MIAKFRMLLFLAALSAFALPLGSSVAVHAQAPAPAAADQPPVHAGGEASLILPDLGTQSFMGINARTLLMGGLVVCVLGLAFGMVIFYRLKNMPVHRSMLEVSELIYETCKTYLITQGKFILILEAFIAVIIVLYFGFLTAPTGPDAKPALRVIVILLFS